MRLETAVTERDKKLLYGAGLAAAVLLYGVFALSPALQAHAAAVREAAQDAYPLLSSEELDTIVTGLALDSGLQPLALTIGAATAPDLQGYALSACGDGTLPPAGTGGLQAVALQGTAQGTYAAFAALLDDLAANYPALQLRSFTVSESAWLTAAGGAETQVEFRYELTAYMYDTEGLAE